ncbi:MAG: lycopene cyclase, partial [Bacteroidetes bacterium]
DIAIAGGGLSGLTLAVELSRTPGFRDMRIVLIDRETKRKNDRTWCFWATDEEYLPPVICKSWDTCNFLAQNLDLRMAIAPYRYHMIRGVDFYNWAREEVAQNPNVDFLTANITALEANTGTVVTDHGAIEAGLIFNSAMTNVAILPEPSTVFPRPPISSGGFIAADDKRAIRLLQHFKGWMVQTETPVFDPASITFMDFRIPQQGETRFVYVLPLEANRALVEFTVFSPALLPASAYDDALKDYVTDLLSIRQFRILEEEFGVIPMTDFRFPATPTGNIIHIGTAGGFVKPSSGYAFKRTIHRIRHFVADWDRTGAPNTAILRSSRTFRALDSIFLQVLQDNNQLGSTVFSSLFAKLPPDLVLRFLDEETTFAENLRLVGAPPTGPFLKAFARQLPRLLRN